MIALIAAFSKQNRVIAKDSKIPWKIDGELERFKRLTTNNVVIMGRNTFEEIGKPLPKRINIVISRTKNFIEENLFTVSSFEESFSLAQSFKKDIFFIGGEEIFKKSLPLCEKLFLTEIFDFYDGDRFFPLFDETKYTAIIEKNDEKNGYRYLTYTKKSAFH